MWKLGLSKSIITFFVCSEFIGCWTFWLFTVKIDEHSFICLTCLWIVLKWSIALENNSFCYSVMLVLPFRKIYKSDREDFLRRLPPVRFLNDHGLWNYRSTSRYCYCSRCLKSFESLLNVWVMVLFRLKYHSNVFPGCYCFPPECTPLGLMSHCFEASEGLLLGFLERLSLNLDRCCSSLVWPLHPIIIKCIDGIKHQYCVNIESRSSSDEWTLNQVYDSLICE